MKESHTEAAIEGVLQEKLFLEILQNSQENICVNKVAGLRPKVRNFIKKETLTLVFSCEFFIGLRPATLLKKETYVFSFEFCKISKTTFFTEQVWANASALAKKY